MTLAPSGTEADRRVLLHDISWEGYLSLLDVIGDGAARLTYDSGALEIEMPSQFHEILKRIAGALVETALEELGIDYQPFGSTTWKHAAREKGLEADDCFYITSLSAVRGKSEIDLNIDPPPDLAIEAEITLPALSKMDVYAALGVPELWRVLQSGEVRIYRLSAERQYTQVSRSLTVSIAEAESLSQHVRMIAPLGFQSHSEVVRQFRKWARERALKSRQ